MIKEIKNLNIRMVLEVYHLDLPFKYQIYLTNSYNLKLFSELYEKIFHNCSFIKVLIL